MGKWSTSDRGSNASKQLEGAWAIMRNLIPGLPRAVMVVLDAAGRNRKHGHFAHSSWKARGGDNAHEIAISPRLFELPKDLFGTLLHEAAHAANFAAGIRDCTGRYYHRKEFRNRCFQLGLDCQFLNTRYGWCLTSWPAGQVPDRYQRVLQVLGEIPKGTGRQGLSKTKGRKLPRPGHVRLVCDCQRSIYASRLVAAEAAIQCSACGSSFRPAG